MGKNFGVIILPEGLIEFVPEVNVLIKELNEILAKQGNSPDSAQSDVQVIRKSLTASSRNVFDSLPHGIRSELLLERDPHGNVQVSRIETEKLFIHLASETLAKWKKEGKYKGSFAALSHFFGYEGRCTLPSNFDSNYCYSLGYAAAALVESGKTGYMATVTGLTNSVTEWKAGGVPLTLLMNIERRSGKDKPVVKKALVDLNDRPFKALVKRRDKWAKGECYVNPGPMQFHGPASDAVTMTLLLESGDKASHRPFKSFL